MKKPLRKKWFFHVNFVKNPHLKFSAFWGKLALIQRQTCKIEISLKA